MAIPLVVFPPLQTSRGGWAGCWRDITCYRKCPDDVRTMKMTRLTCRMFCRLWKRKRINNGCRTNVWDAVGVHSLRWRNWCLGCGIVQCFVEGTSAHHLLHCVSCVCHFGFAAKRFMRTHSVPEIAVAQILPFWNYGELIQTAGRLVISP
jgi:hypothetical protein